VTGAQAEIQALAAVTAVACALPGAFLVLRRQAMVSDAITHSVLLGIVVAFLLVEDLSSPLLLIGAALTGVLTVFLVEVLQRTRLVREDAAIGLVFPALFSIGVILIARFADGVHLDIDVVLLGEIAFAPLERFEAFGWDWGPTPLVEMSAILLVNAGLISILFKELKVATFDAGLAYALGFSPALVHYGLMSLVSVTAVGAFDAVGSILVVALMVGPPAAAYLLTDRLGVLLVLAAALGAGGAIAGYWLAHWVDASIAGAIAVVLGLEFAVVFLLAPGRGVIAHARRRARQRIRFAETMLAIHLLNHERSPEVLVENRVASLRDHLRWETDFAERIVRSARHDGLVAQRDGLLELTDAGRRLAEGALAHT
jgi:manganese/zinc/iron transport system permease protein